MRLESLSGFPEPYLSGRAATYRRWSGTYSRQLVREDIRDLGGIRSAIDVETLYDLLPSKVGSPLSVPSLAQDLKVAYNTVQSWLALFERFFLTFSLPTWTARVARAIHKERKIYLLDAPRIEDPAARFENLAALELWRAVSCWNALGEGDFSLHFVRNKEKQEADFLIVEGRKPLLLIETNSPTNSHPRPSSRSSGSSVSPRCSWSVTPKPTGLSRGIPCRSWSPRRGRGWLVCRGDARMFGHAPVQGVPEQFSRTLPNRSGEPA